MNESKRGAALSIAIVIAGSAIAAFASVYASGSAARRFESSGSEARSGVAGSWLTRRSGSVVGRSESKDGGRAYLLVIRRLGSESRSVAVLGPDGGLRSIRLISSGGSPEYAIRMEALLNRAGGRKAEGLGSPLDASVLPLVEDAVATAVAMFAEEKDEDDARR